MKKLLLPILLLFAIQLSAQKPAVFLELGGSGGVGSLNFERSFLTREKVDLKWRAGFSLFRIDRNTGTSLIFPILAEVLVGEGPHYFEAGIGQTFTVTTEASFFLLMPAVAGYRYQPPDKRIFFRASYTPIISYLLDFQYQNWGGLSIGYQFK